MPFGYGICLRHHLIVRRDSKDLVYVVAHELTHWEQWILEGSYIKWLAKYFIELIHVGYGDNRYEQEARRRGSEFAMRQRAKDLINEVTSI